MNEYMLMFSLGPVQPFIAQARKTRDLWLGSFLLSILMEAAMKGIEENALIFPSKPTIKGNIPDLPNKYVALFNNPDEAYQVAEQSKQKIEEHWRAICEDVWSKIMDEHIRSSTSIPRSIWDRQINPDNFFEIFWVVVKRTSEHYNRWLYDTQATFDARKRLRDFRHQEEQGEKSTISGEREVLHGKGISRQDVQTFWYELTKELPPKDISTDGTERLDAIDIVKRFAYRSGILRAKNVDANFPSTSSIATASFVERLIAESNHPQLSSAIQQWLSETTKLGEMMPAAIPFLKNQAAGKEIALRILECDGDCYFHETFTSHRLKKDYGFSDDKKASRDSLVAKGQKALTLLLHEADALPQPISRPTPYYAMIQMDGDKMGTLLSGVEGQEEHKNISKALSNFSREVVPQLVQDYYPGRLVYAGGDDVFALAPLARDIKSEDQNEEILTVLDLVNRLQREYHHTVEKTVSTEERKKKVTASTGIAIAHHFTSLSYVRRVSKAAEEEAKKHYGRNALVVTLIRRSGEQTRVGCHWKYEGLSNEGQPLKLFAWFYRLIKQDILSPKCIYTILEEAPVLVRLGKDAQQSEIRRVLLRQRSQGYEKELSNAKVKELAQYIAELAEAMDKDKKPSEEEEEKSVDLHSADRRRYGLVEVLGWLLVMIFLARKEQD